MKPSIAGVKAALVAGVRRVDAKVLKVVKMHVRSATEHEAPTLRGCLLSLCCVKSFLVQVAACRRPCPVLAAIAASF